MEEGRGGTAFLLAETHEQRAPASCCAWWFKDRKGVVGGGEMRPKLRGEKYCLGWEPKKQEAHRKETANKQEEVDPGSHLLPGCLPLAPPVAGTNRVGCQSESMDSGF